MTPNHTQTALKQAWPGHIFVVYHPLGTKLRLKIEKLIEQAEPAPMMGWRLLNIHAHTATKFAALLDRSDTEKARGMPARPTGFSNTALIR